MFKLFENVSKFRGSSRIFVLDKFEAQLPARLHRRTLSLFVDDKSRRQLASHNRHLVSSLSTLSSLYRRERGQRTTNLGWQCFRLVHTAPKPITCVTRSVMFEDVQMYKVVHGGVYLEITEEAGDMIVNQHCIQRDEHSSMLPFVPVLTKIEKTQFLGKAVLGEILTGEGEVIYTSPHSIRVLVSIYATSLIGNNDRRLVSRSWLWYVLINGNNTNEILPVRPLEITDLKLEEEGRVEHEKNKLDRQRRLQAKTIHTMEYNCSFAAKSSHIISRSACGWKAFSRAGPILKAMDELTGYVAIRYAQVPCVTGVCDDVNFYSKLMPGSFVTLTAIPVFTSSKTLDIQCLADVETVSDGRIIKERAVEAFFTYVAVRLNATHDPTVPQFQPQTAKEKETYERRLKVYQKRKENSKASASR